MSSMMWLLYLFSYFVLLIKGTMLIFFFYRMFKEDLESAQVPISERLLRQQFQNWFRSNVSFLSYVCSFPFFNG
jgi:hypothetical protein